MLLITVLCIQYQIAVTRFCCIENIIYAPPFFFCGISYVKMYYKLQCKFLILHSYGCLILQIDMWYDWKVLTSNVHARRKTNWESINMKCTWCMSFSKFLLQNVHLWHINNDFFPICPTFNFLDLNVFKDFKNKYFSILFCVTVKNV